MKQPIEVGQYYEDCAYHVVYCTEVYPVYNATRWSKLRMRLRLTPDDWDIGGTSMVDGSAPRSCSWNHCAPMKLTSDQIDFLMNARKWEK